MSTATETPVQPKPAPTAMPKAAPPVPRAAGNKPAAPAAAGAKQPEAPETPAAPKVSSVELQIWMNQLVLVMSMAAAGVSMLVARMCEREWLSCAFCATAAAIIAACGGTFLARMIGAQILTTEGTEQQQPGLNN